jgi:hypothetical protein
MRGEFNMSLPNGWSPFLPTSLKKYLVMESLGIVLMIGLAIGFLLFPNPGWFVYVIYASVFVILLAIPFMIADMYNRIRMEPVYKDYQKIVVPEPVNISNTIIEKFLKQEFPDMVSLPKSKYVFGFPPIYRYQITRTRNLFLLQKNYLITEVKYMFFGPIVNDDDYKLVERIDKTLNQFINRPLQRR